MIKKLFNIILSLFKKRSPAIKVDGYFYGAVLPEEVKFMYEEFND